jgi:hypothetical protein
MQGKSHKPLYHISHTNLRANPIYFCCEHEDICLNLDICNYHVRLHVSLIDVPSATNMKKPCFAPLANMGKGPLHVLKKGLMILKNQIKEKCNKLTSQLSSLSWEEEEW